MSRAGAITRPTTSVAAGRPRVRIRVLPRYAGADAGSGQAAAFFRTPEMPWLYSGVTMTNPSNDAIFSAHCLVCSFWYCPSDGGSGSSRADVA